MGKIIEVKHKGSFWRAERFFKKNKRRDYVSILKKYGEAGVTALQNATPKDSGKTAESWSYSIVRDGDNYTLYWKNSNRNDGANVAILIQMGHGTGSGVYIEGNDFINPALQEVFGDLSWEVWKAVTD